MSQYREVGALTGIELEERRATARDDCRQERRAYLAPNGPDRVVEIGSGAANARPGDLRA